MEMRSVSPAIFARRRRPRPVDLVQEARRTNDPCALYRLGRMYLRLAASTPSGSSTHSSSSSSSPSSQARVRHAGALGITALKVAASAGSKPAAIELGLMFLRGGLVGRRNVERARRLLEEGVRPSESEADSSSSSSTRTGAATSRRGQRRRRSQLTGLAHYHLGLIKLAISSSRYPRGYTGSKDGRGGDNLGGDSWRETYSHLAKAAKCGIAHAQLLVGMLQLATLDLRADADRRKSVVGKAMPHIARAAKQGHRRAQVVYAQCLCQFSSAPAAADLPGAAAMSSSWQSLAWVEQAARGGLADAQWVLGRWYERGDGPLQQSYPEAARWLGLAGGQGHGEALVELGLLLESGEGVGGEPNVPLAADCFKRAAKRGHVGALVHLARLTLTTQGTMGEGGLVAESSGGACDGGSVNSPFVQAAVRLRNAARKGHPRAQLGLAKVLLARGLREEAGLWLRACADGGGNVDTSASETARLPPLTAAPPSARLVASFMVGVELLRHEEARRLSGVAEGDGGGGGGGGDVDDDSVVEAVRRLTDAAARGAVRAAFLLGFAFASGYGGVAQDRKAALTWFSAAAKTGQSPASWFNLGLLLEQRARMGSFKEEEGQVDDLLDVEGLDDDDLLDSGFDEEAAENDGFDPMLGDQLGGSVDGRTKKDEAQRWRRDGPRGRRGQRGQRGRRGGGGGGGTQRAAAACFNRCLRELSARVGQTEGGRGSQTWRSRLSSSDSLACLSTEEQYYYGICLLRAEGGGGGGGGDSLDGTGSGAVVPEALRALSAAAAAGHVDAAFAAGLAGSRQAEAMGTAGSGARSAAEAAAASHLLFAAKKGHAEAARCVARLFEKGQGGMKQDFSLASKWYTIATSSAAAGGRAARTLAVGAEGGGGFNEFMRRRGPPLNR